MMKRIGKILLGAAFCLLPALPASPAEAAAVKVFVSIAPQKYFVQKIAGDLAEVSVLVPAGADPHTFEPKPRQMVELSKTALYFAVGIDFEKTWLKKISATNPKMRIVRTDEGIPKIAMAAHRHGRESGPERAAAPHGHVQDGDGSGAGSPDPHVWLSPALVRIQANHILRAFLSLDPAHRTRYEDNHARFLARIDALHAELTSLFAGRKGERFMVFHPSWGYFADAYGLGQIPVEIEGKEPKPALLRKLIRRARERGIRVIFVQPQFSAKSAELLAREIGGKVVYADPLAENWEENLREVARKFQAAAR